MALVKRSDENPILVPDKEHPWESEVVFNGCPIRRGKVIHLLYRAVSSFHYHADTGTTLRMSTVGDAVSRDGIHFRKRRQLIIPEKDWERFGCEDPRVTKLNGKYFIFYTALSTYPLTAEGIRVGLAISKDLRHIDKKYPVTPFNAKAMALDSHSISLARSDQDHVEIGAPPVKTPHGWLLIYSHIRNYFSQNKVFGIEAVLLDLKNPQRIVGRTEMPLLVPEEEYEIYGQVPNIVFPSGVLLERGTLRLYYGAADSTCCLATVSIKQLLEHILAPQKFRVSFERAPANPIIQPIDNHGWEQYATFNPAAFFDGKRVHILYRAMSNDRTSVFGYASSRDGVHIEERLPEPVYVPREPFEQKAGSGNSGCEDPRLTKIGQTLYMCYTAFDGQNPPRVALTSIPLQKFLQKNWQWEKPALISPPGIDDKDACIFPKKVRGLYMIFHRIRDSVDVAYAKDLRFHEKDWLEEHKWLRPRKGAWDSLKVGIATPPLKTTRGWVLLYHGVSEEDHVYRVGAVLLDLKEPERILARTAYPLFEPEAPYEKNGQVPNVVFPCGAVIIKKKLFIYYGGADSVVGVASIEIPRLMRTLAQ